MHIWGVPEEVRGGGLYVKMLSASIFLSLQKNELTKIYHIHHPLRSGRIGHKVNF